MKTLDRKNGFTLIEVLASMAVLAVLVLMLGGFFDQATRAWTQGETQVTLYDMARGAMDEIYRDTTTAVADRNLPFAVRNFYSIVWDHEKRPPRGVGLVSRGDFRDSAGIGRTDGVRMITAISARSQGKDFSDFYDVMYHVAYDEETGRGQLKRRASAIYGTRSDPPPWRGVNEYVVGGDGDLQDEQSLFERPEVALADENMETLLDNVYAFEVTAYEDRNPVQDFYSKDRGFLPPDRVDYRLVVLADDVWARRETFTSDRDWHDFARSRGEVFVVRAVIPTRGRSP